MDLEQLRKFRGSKGNSLSNIAKAMEEQGSKKNYHDDRYWSLQADKAGNGSAVIRFLPAENMDDLPWVKLYTHGFQGPAGKWYIENCLTTIGQEDPCVEHTGDLWNSGLESDKEIARQRKRRLGFISNVLVINDSSNPENNGKVFMFRYGKKIFDKISDVITPQFEDEVPCDVFHPYEGANFRLKMRRVEGYANFDKSSFDTISMIDEDEEKMVAILSSRHNIKEIIDPKNFKSYDELKKRLDFVLTSGKSNITADEMDLVEEKFKSKEEPKVKSKVESNDDDVDMAFFQNLIDE